MRLFHGTSDAALPRIRQLGLRSPYLTDDAALARYYAEAAVDEMNGGTVILVVEVESTWLRYDRAAMDEPVMASADERDAQWRMAAREHPEWVNDGLISIPETAFEYSLRGVNSVRCCVDIHAFTILSDQ